MRDKIIELLPPFQDGYLLPEDVADHILEVLSEEPIWSGKLDKNAKRINRGDIVHYHNVSRNTKPEYWNPIYEVVWNSPCFELKHIGGGKQTSNMAFIFRYYPEELEVIKGGFVNTEGKEDE